MQSYSSFAEIVTKAQKGDLAARARLVELLQMCLKSAFWFNVVSYGGWSGVGAKSEMTWGLGTVEGFFRVRFGTKLQIFLTMASLSQSVTFDCPDFGSFIQLLNETRLTPGDLRELREMAVRTNLPSARFAPQSDALRMKRFRPLPKHPAAHGDKVHGAKLGLRSECKPRPK